MRYLIWPASAGLLLAACGPAQETADPADEGALDAQPELVDPVIDDPMDDPGMAPPPDMMDGDPDAAMSGDPAMTEEPNMADDMDVPPAETDETEPEDPAAPDG